MSNAVYGSDVVYIMCKANEIDSVPIMDGQLVVLRDSSGMYYDVGSTRYTIGGVEIVSSLPSSGKKFTIYVVLDGTEYTGLYLYTGKTFVSLMPEIPEPAISEDAPDNIWSYLRIKGKWQPIEFTFYMDSENLESNMQRYTTWVNDVPEFSIAHLVGKLSYQESQFPLKFNHPGLIYDFSQLDLSEYIAGAEAAHPFEDSASWNILEISNSAGVTGLKCKRAKISLSYQNIDEVSVPHCPLVEHCNLVDSRIDLLGRTSDVSISNCIFRMTDRTFVPIVECSPEATLKPTSANLTSNTFIFEGGTGCAMIGLLPTEYNIYSNVLDNCIMLSKFSDIGEVSTLSVDVIPYETISEEIEYEDYIILPTKHNNEMTVFTRLNDDWDFLKWVCRNKWNYLLDIGDVLYYNTGTEGKNIYLGVAEFNYTSGSSSQCTPNVVFEINPCRCTSYSDVSEESFESLVRKYCIPIYRKIPSSPSEYKSTLLTPMLLTDMLALEDIDSSVFLAQTHFYLTSRLSIYVQGKDYNVRKHRMLNNDSKWDMYSSDSVCQCFLTPDAFESLDSESFDNSSQQHFAVKQDGSAVAKTSFGNSDDIRLMIAL